MEDKIIHSKIKDSRVLTYLNQRKEPEYENTDEENILQQLWDEKYNLAVAEYEQSRANSTKVKYWREAFEGKFKQLDNEGNATDKNMKAIRKLAFELVEGKINAHIPAVKMTPRYYSDIIPVSATESLIKHELDRMMSEENNDKAEHYACIDGSVWLKASWNPFDNTHERSGNPIISVHPIDTIFPQPGIDNYKNLEYIFEKTSISVAQCLDLYGREIKAIDNNDIIKIINCYYLNEERYIGKFTWCEDTGKVLCNDLEWGIHRRRECAKCNTVVNFENKCPVCGSKDFNYVPVKELILDEDLDMIDNPYRSGDTQDATQDKNMISENQTIPKNSKIPHYLIRQLPFVLYKRISAPNSIYGISEVELILENQDIINKMLNKAERKSAKSQAYITKLKDTRIQSDSDELTYLEIESPQEGQAIQVKQIQADITQEITQSQMLYEIAKSTVGITDTDQGKADPTARSGKAKQLQMAASAQRNNSPTTLRNLAYSNIYELIFKHLLAYSDEKRAFISLMPNGTTKEEAWSRYMFLAKDKNGELYYRDDFAWSVDTASEITQDRASMWQLIDNDFMSGTMGTNVDPNKALLMYWNMKDQNGYPLAKFALNFLKDAQQNLPSEIEKVLVNNPDAVQMALSYIQDKQKAEGLGGTGSNSGQQGGARANAGRTGNNATHATNVERTNEKNRIQSGSAQTNTNATKTGGMQGGIT